MRTITIKLFNGPVQINTPQKNYRAASRDGCQTITEVMRSRTRGTSRKLAKPRGKGDVLFAMRAYAQEASCQ